MSGAAPTIAWDMGPANIARTPRAAEARAKLAAAAAKLKKTLESPSRASPKAARPKVRVGILPIKVPAIISVPKTPTKARSPPAIPPRSSILKMAKAALIPMRAKESFPNAETVAASPGPKSVRLESATTMPPRLTPNPISPCAIARKFISAKRLITPSTRDSATDIAMSPTDAAKTPPSFRLSAIAATVKAVSAAATLYPPEANSLNLSFEYCLIA